MIFDTNVNIVVKTTDQYLVLPKCSYIECDPVKEYISIEWNDVESETTISKLIFPNSLFKKIFLANEFEDLLFIIEFAQNGHSHYHFGKLINYIRSSQDYKLRIVLSKLNLSFNDFAERLKNMFNALTPNCNLIDGAHLVTGTIDANEVTINAITPYNRMFDPNVFETKIYGIVRVPVMSDIFYNAPYTTIKWKDGTTTTVKAGKDDEFNKEYGLAMAIAKKYYECLEAPNPRAAFKKAAYKDAHDQTEKTSKKRAYKEEKKKRNKRGRISSSKKTSKR